MEGQLSQDTDQLTNTQVNKSIESSEKLQWNKIKDKLKINLTTFKISAQKLDIKQWSEVLFYKLVPAPDAE